jgi:hypothetical protein
MHVQLERYTRLATHADIDIDIDIDTDTDLYLLYQHSYRYTPSPDSQPLMNISPILRSYYILLS